ncbi:MAG: N-acetylmuramoyl-L-alanine amidase [Myxococcota bacterium]|nr:N-acetylmuramoyl-L-alanine amidase [Myxococcota bacterium]
MRLSATELGALLPLLLLYGPLLSSCGEEGAAPEQAPVELAASEKVVELPVVRRAWRRVVLDAGHGGQDTGAKGVSGALEKEITLAISSACARQLRAEGFEVLETRSSDEAIPLERRSAQANAAGAGLFLSIHANSAPSEGVQGIETYYMDLAADEAAARLAERENRARSVSGDPTQSSVDSLISDLRMGATAKQSRALAETVHRSMLETLRGFYGPERIRDRGVRTAPFWVLLDSQMPAILVEVGYLTNTKEEQRLRTHGFQQQVASGLTKAIIEFADIAAAAEPGPGEEGSGSEEGL